MSVFDEHLPDDITPIVGDTFPTLNISPGPLPGRICPDLPPSKPDVALDAVPSSVGLVTLPNCIKIGKFTLHRLNKQLWISDGVRGYSPTEEDVEHALQVLFDNRWHIAKKHV